MGRIDIVLVKPGSQKQLYGPLSDFQLTAIEPPFWAALLAGYLREKGYRVVLCDAEANDWDYAATAREIAGINPYLAAVIVSGTNPSASTMNMIGALTILSKLKNITPNIATLLGGLHPSALPEQTIAAPEVDFVCQGEGFFTLPGLVEALRTDDHDFAIPGLWYKKDSLVMSNPAAPLCMDLDVFPRPAWDLLPMGKYRAHNWHCLHNIDQRQPYGILYTSLGCPFQCSFCCINALFGKNIIRYRGLDNILSEIDFMVNTYGIKNIKIIDEMFALNEKRVTALCDLIIERQYDLNIWAYARVNTVTPPMLAKMKAAGINWLAYGFESGSQAVIEDVAKGFRLDKVYEVVNQTRQQGIHICANYIFGLPRDDYATMNKTLQLMLEINAEWANIYSAMAFPGSRLFRQARRKNWPLPETWQGYSQYAFECLPLQTEHLSGGQVLAFRDYAFHAYYENPAYLNMINRKFGKAAMTHIQEMSQKRLARKYASL